MPPITDVTQGEDQLELAFAPLPSSPLTLDSVTQEIEDEAGFTDICFLYTNLKGIAADIPLIIRVQGVAGLSSEDFTINDSTLDGGAGDDILRSDLFLFDGGPNGNFDTFITGPGADRIEITTFSVGGPGDINLGLLGTVTDFTLGEDMIFVDPSQLVREIISQDFDNAGDDFVSEYEQDFIFCEHPDGAFTDLEFTFTETGTGGGAQMTGTIRLEGLTGITADDIAFAQLEPQAQLFVHPGIVAGF